MMYLSEKYKFIYFGPSKNASTSIISLLVRDFAAIGISVSDPPRTSAWALGPHHSCFLPEKYKYYFKFTSVRNPFDRAVSWYKFLPGRDVTRFVQQMNFSEFIQEMCYGKILNNWRLDCWKYSQNNLIFDQPLRKDCIPVTIDGFIKVETLEKDLNQLPFVDKIIKIEVENQSPDRKTIIFPSSLIDMFVLRYKEDFTRFDYEMMPVDRYKLWN